jgi:FkbM family methyltransferase
LRGDALPGGNPAATGRRRTNDGGFLDTRVLRERGIGLIFWALPGVYGIANRAGLLEPRPVRRSLQWFYFQYKKYVEDPFHGLTKRRDLFAGGHVFDIGANLGYTALQFAAAIEPPYRVHAFEPSAQNFELLSEAAAARWPDRVEAHRMAVGASAGTVRFWHNVDHGGDHRVMTEHWAARTPPGSAATEVPMTSLDEFRAGSAPGPVSFIKIDVQGYELAVCEGMVQTLAENPRAAVAIEYAPKSLRDLGFEPQRLLEFFRDRGYTPHIIYKSGRTEPTDDAGIEDGVRRWSYLNLLFLSLSSSPR